MDSSNRAYDNRPHKRHLALFHERRKAVGAQRINVNAVHEEFKVRLGGNGKVASVLTAIYGSMWFVYFLALGVTSWMLVQSLLGKRAFDPYPFIFCLFVGNLIQLVGGPIIQVGQNLASVHSELRAEADYHVNQESFALLEEIKAMQGVLEAKLAVIEAKLPAKRTRGKEGGTA